MAVDIPWDMELLSTPPAFSIAEGFDKPGVTPVFFDGPPYRGKPTRVFAWIGMPEVKGDRKVPAMVLVHGGGATALAHWVRLWTKRGYAAIAMDTCGCVPRGEKYGDWDRCELPGPPGAGRFDKTDEPIEDHWVYHAVSAVIRSHSLIRSRPEVDAERIGLTGISWGGFLTCIAGSVDPRFRFAVPVYGCGFIYENSATEWLEKLNAVGPEHAARWASLWDPSVYLPRMDRPMLWVTGTNDFAFPMDSLQKSYRLPTGPRALSVGLRMAHGHDEGENPEIIHAFANEHLCGGPPLTHITAQGNDGRTLWAEYAATEPIEKADLLFTADDGPWQEREWHSVAAEVNADGRVYGRLPENARVGYLNLTDRRGLFLSSEHEVFSEIG